MDFTSILNQGLGLAQTLSFASGNPLAIVGTSVIQVAANIIESCCGDGADSPDSALVTAITNAANGINAHLDEVVNEVRDVIQNEQMQQEQSVLNGIASDFSDQQAAFYKALHPPEKVKQSALVANFHAALNDFNSTFPGNEIELYQVIAFSEQCCDESNYYVGLPLLMASTLFYANYLKYASTVSLQFAAMQIADGKSKGSLNFPPLIQTGVALDLNTKIYNRMQEAFNKALPLVLQLNAALVQRQTAANTAAAECQVTQADNGYSVNTGVAVSDPATPQHWDVGYTQLGYGTFLTPDSAQLIAMLVNAQGRQLAWVNDTVSNNLYLFDRASILKLNYCLYGLWQSMGTYFNLIGPNGTTPPPPQPAGIFQPPPPKP